jgi:hypothetical protein
VVSADDVSSSEPQAARVSARVAAMGATRRRRFDMGVLSRGDDYYVV